MVEIVSPGNKATRHGLRSFIEKAAELLDRGVHLLMIDLLPPTPREPRGMHAALWEEVAGQDYALPPSEPLTVAAYESDLAIRTYVRAFRVGDAVPEMPLFLRPKACVQVPLDASYRDAFAAMPIRWRTVLEQ